MLSKNETDVGTYYLDLIANSSSENVSFKVKVILAIPTSIDLKTQTNPILKEVNTPTASIETKKEESIMFLDSEIETLLEIAACVAEEANDISCVLPNGFSFKIDGGFGNTFSGDRK